MVNKHGEQTRGKQTQGEQTWRKEERTQLSDPELPFMPSKLGFGSAQMDFPLQFHQRFVIFLVVQRCGY